MSVPFHIEEEIMKRLPVKSLIQFRSVSKAWKSLIDSSEFITAHSLRRHTQQQHLLLSYKDLSDEEKYVCYIDDDTFPQQRSVPALPLSFKRLKMKKVIGSSRGLLCFYGLDPYFCRRTVKVVLWNPSVRKSIAIFMPGSSDGVGFGFCPVTGDHKIVSITECRDVHEPNLEGISRCKVMVYTLSSGKWRTLSTNLPTIRLFWDLCSIVITDGFIYWHEQDRKMIMSFDVTNESFEVIDLRNTLATFYIYKIYKIRESLAIVQYRENDCDVWMMEHGVQRLFTKLFTIKTPYVRGLVGFRKNDVPIMIVTDNGGHSKLVVYEPNSKNNNVISPVGLSYAFHVTSYMETLLFLGGSDCNGILQFGASE